MRTQFSAAQRADPALAAAEKIIRSCVHCGFCTATCPTYVLRGDELDSPRGRIALIQNMLESGGAPSAAAVTHIDRCLSCLGCTTTCPSGVDYHRLIDQARAHIAQHHHRPWRDQLGKGSDRPRNGHQRRCGHRARLPHRVQRHRRRHHLQRGGRHLVNHLVQRQCLYQRREHQL